MGATHFRNRQHSDFLRGHPRENVSTPTWIQKEATEDTAERNKNSTHTMARTSNKKLRSRDQTLKL